MPNQKPTRLACLSLLLATLTAAALPNGVRAATTLIDPQPQDIHTLLTSGGLENPEVIFAFNPQPDPPGRQSYLDLTNPEAPSLLLPAVRGTYGLVIGFPYGGFTFSSIPAGPTVTNLGAFFQFDATAADGSVFQVDLTLGGYIGDWVGFNPQPDPPGDIGFAFTADPQATLQIFQITANGDLPLSFFEVPEPATLSLLGLGGMALAAARRRRRT